MPKSAILTLLYLALLLPVPARARIIPIQAGTEPARVFGVAKSR